MAIHPKKLEQIERDAVRVYEVNARARTPEVIEMFGEPRGVAAATLDEIRAHMLMVAEIESHYATNLDPMRYWGETAEQITNHARARAQSEGRRRGARHLRDRVGEDIARKIIKGR